MKQAVLCDALRLAAKVKSKVCLQVEAKWIGKWIETEAC